MKVALIDNGSLEPASHRLLRAVACSLSGLAGAEVEAVSWRHSDRIPAAELDGVPARTLDPWIRARHARGEREFLFVPFLVSAGGAIAGSIRASLQALREELGGFAWTFTAGFSPAAEVLSGIVAARLREAAEAAGLARPPVIVVDHGGPARASAELRDAVAAGVRARLAGRIGPLSAASMESPEGPGFEFNRPLLAEQLRAPGFNRGPVLIAPLFLGPGRHAGPEGDLARIASAAPGVQAHFAGLLGSHPLAVAALAESLRERLPAPAVL